MGGCGIWGSNEVGLGWVGRVGCWAGFGSVGYGGYGIWGSNDVGLGWVGEVGYWVGFGSVGFGWTRCRVR